MDYSSLIIDYLDDAQSHLNVFDTALMSLEKHGYNREVIQNSLGSLHTLTGNSGMMGFDYRKSYIHTLEELLKKILDRELSLSRMLDTLFTSANVIRTTLQYSEEDLRREAADVLRSLPRVAGEPIAEAPVAQPAPARVYPLPATAASVREQRPSFEDGDEGFRVVRRGSSPPNALSRPEPKTPPPGEPPKPSLRVFGEDDL